MLLLAIIYLAFISLGLPDSLLGASWPIISQDINSSIAFAGVVSIIISIGTVISSLMSTRAIHRFGTGKVVLMSVAMTAIALYGFSFAQNIWFFVILAIPLGLGAGAIDAALNTFVAIHYKSKHMNFLHSFWGVGATSGPLIMAMYIGQQGGWRDGYATISYIQITLVAILFLTLPLWRHATNYKHSDSGSEQSTPVSNMMALNIKGVKVQLLMFFCYCALEAATGLWAASFLMLEHNISASDAAFWTAMYFLGITLGRFSCGFIADAVDENKMIATGVFVICGGVLLMLFPHLLMIENTSSWSMLPKAGLVLIGLGCAPIYPNTIHLTPARFGKNASQAIIGLSMAFAYVGTTLMPPLIGFLASFTSFMILPLSLILLAIILLVTTNKLKTL
tara:strand:+ start:39979 stop:41157 length:1179 start_codon:yes stop_codon:yes gene_type:complete